MMPNLKMYKDKEGRKVGYDVEKLVNWMKKRQLLKAWKKWAHGSTGAIIDGHFIVYEWDVESFLNGELNLD